MLAVWEQSPTKNRNVRQVKSPYMLSQVSLYDKGSDVTLDEGLNVIRNIFYPKSKLNQKARGPPSLWA